MAALVAWVGAAAALAALAYLLRWLSVPFRSTRNDPPALSYVHTFADTKTGKEERFPDLLGSSPTKYVSLVLPAYNEEERLHPCMAATMKYLESRARADPKFTYEVIIVDDGSRDRTSEVALGYSRQYGSETVRLLRLAKNQGKGGAVQQGVLHSRGRYILMMDSDGATEIEDFAKVERELLRVERDGLGVGVGSRAHLEKQSEAERKWYRTVLMHGFHALVAVLCVRSIRDTQCGFKLFSRRAAAVLFTTQHLRRWSFDVELLFVAEKLGIPLAEVGVRWEEVPGSKLDLLSGSLQMARDLVVIRLAYTLGIWKVSDAAKSE